MIDLGTFRVVAGNLVAWDPRPHPRAWFRDRSARERRSLARARTRGRRGAVRILSFEPQPASRMPDVVREMVNPYEGLEKRERAILAEMEQLARRIGVFGAFHAREGLAAGRMLDNMGMTPDPAQMGRHATTLEADARCEELSKELRQIDAERDALSPLRRGAVAFTPEYIELRPHEFGVVVKTSRRCGCTEQCWREGYHVEDVRLTLYCEGDPAAQERAVNQALAAKVREIQRANEPWLPFDPSCARA